DQVDLVLHSLEQLVVDATSHGAVVRLLP
ncbi:phosphatase, partial [Yersinia pestis]